MTTAEFSVEFDILYNDIQSDSAPGLDGYEKSVFLSNAQEELVLNTYSGINVLRESFDETELNKRFLDKLIKQSSITDTISNAENFSSDTIFFEVPDDLMAIVNERVKIDSATACYDGKIINVLPIKYDEYNIQINNPFRKPKLTGRTNYAWRIDYGDVTSQRVVELVNPEGGTCEEYIIRYLRKPQPIILENINSLYGQTIDGIGVTTESELDPITHRTILINAVQKAKIAYQMANVAKN